ncbi:uncharacterized protein RJT20DRAFT_134723 [Scheffersomyces xylosifermentans]|uniref:uncharacterized protein n=1 Tax=Scheffersomyces xylosifermentans TaxID=1304137 RepID=UPI00315CD471
MNDSNSSSSKDRLEDLASLFLPDILHPIQSNSHTPSGGGTANNASSNSLNNPNSVPTGSSTSTVVKQEVFDSISPEFNLLRRDSLNSHTNTPPTTNSDGSATAPRNTSNANVNANNSANASAGQVTTASFNDFLHNNNFINSTSQSAMLGQNFTSPLSNTMGSSNQEGLSELQNQQTNIQSSSNQQLLSNQSQQSQYQQQLQQSQQPGHVNHYAGFIPFEASTGIASSIQSHHHQNHMSMFSVNPQFNGMYPNQQGSVQNQSPQPQVGYNQFQQQYPQSSLPASSSGSFINTMGFNRTPNNEMNWLQQGSFDNYLGNSSGGQNMNGYGNNSANAIQYGSMKDNNIDMAMQYAQQSQQQSQQHQQQQFANASLPHPSSNVVEDPNKEQSPPKKKKLKAKKIKDIITSEYQIDYKPAKLRRLLDFKKFDTFNRKSDYTIVDKDNNEITIDFNGFLNGRFITNDNDNIYYLLTKKKMDTDDVLENPEVLNELKTEDPRVISCYRRNYIQIAMNMNIHGFKNGDSKLLKLQTSEYGYTITRVIKYFKIEISANISNKGNVPIFIKSKKAKDKSKDAKKASMGAAYEFKEDLAQPSFINTREHIVTLNDDTAIENGQIDKYFVIKKIQFKNATPNNGNLAFQNYYHLKVKLSCVVADLYYDDYVDDEMNNGLNGNQNNQSDNNEIALYELVSEPITVRGRNPSFYAERKDILIKGRSSTSKKSFKSAGRTTNTDEDDEDDQDMNSGLHNDELKDDEDEDDDDPVANKEENDSSSAAEEDEESNNDDGGQEQPQHGNSQTRQQQNDSNYNNNGSQGSSSNSTNLNNANNQLQTQNKTSVSPLAYNTASQATMDLNSGKKYKYFPISNVYYLPPINVVYFPHRAHQDQAQGQKEGTDTQIEQVVNERRKSSNVYFK